MSRRRTDHHGQIGDYWLSLRANSPVWCRTWFDPTTRQTRRASLGTEDFREAQLALAAWITTNGPMIRLQAAEVAFETCLLRYWEHQAKALRSADQARHALRKWSDFFAGAAVSEVTAERVRQFVLHLKGKGLSDGYIRRILASGQAALNRAHREGEISSVPFIDLSLAPEGEPRERVLTVAEMAALFEAVEVDHLFIYLMLAVGTAARPNAILKLTTLQIDQKRRLIRLQPPGVRQTKKRNPTLPICESLWPELRDLPAGPVVSYFGRHVGDIGRAFNRARDRAGLGKDVSPYTIRHTMATELRMRGVPVWEVAGWLGHSSGYKTTERYAKVNPEALAGALRATDAYFADLAAAVEATRPVLSSTSVRASCVLPGHAEGAALSRNPLRKLVEPRRIELLTSTMPL